MVTLHTHISLALLFFPLAKGTQLWHPLTGSLLEQKQAMSNAVLFLLPGCKFICRETKETTFERLHVDQIIESETMLLYFKNNKTWQVMGAHHDLIALGIN